MTISLFQLALNAGIKEEEFLKELERAYATFVSVVLENNPGKVREYIANFTDHDVVIEARITAPSLKPTLN